MPNEKGIKKKVGTEIAEFKDMVFPEGYVPGAKRRAPAGGGGAKKIKIDIPIDVEAEAKAGRVSSVQLSYPARLEGRVLPEEVKINNSQKLLHIREMMFQEGYQ